MPNLLLIDCHTREICRGTTETSYIALSYVWAKAAPNDSGPALLSPQRLPSSDNLSQVVKDSISVTIQLGFRYLWIDKYCIDQSDLKIRTKQIENMDKAYKGAALTLMAAAGLDERHGLAGVG
ncbi:hypothetical protein K491DRAFT_641744, partial [Lophiostoma macrostomum CBS 122681]